MNTINKLVGAALLSAVLLVTGAQAAPVGTEVTYQGQLKENGVPADGTYDLWFELYDSPSAGTLVGELRFESFGFGLDPIEIVDGLFTVQLNFGAGAFDGEARWLQVRAKPHDPTTPQAPYVLMSPRQPVTAAPYAMYALTGPGAGGFWSANGDHIYNTNPGRVGIGTTEPASLFEVTDEANIHGIRSIVPYIPVYAHRASTTGTWPAVHGECDSEVTDGSAIRGIITSTTPGAGSAGVKGINNGTGAAGMGVKGQQDGSGWGVYGTTPDGTGVYGNATGATAINYGVRGKSASPSGYGGHFENTSADGTALYAVSAGGGREDATLQVHNTRASTGMAAYITSVGSWSTAHLQNNGTGEVLWMSRDNTDGPFIVANNESIGGHVFRVEQNGWTTVSVLQITGGADLSEQFSVNVSAEQKPQPGMVVSIDAENPGKLTVSNKAYDRSVAGVISGAGGVKPGMVMGHTDTIADGDHPVALTGRVYVNCDASAGAIKPGDLLTTSTVPGHAMKVSDHTQAQGAILGKAMTSLDEGRGLVLVLVSLQ